MSVINRRAHRPWDGAPADLDAERGDACRCGPEYYERGLIAPDCSADAIFDLCDEVDRLRAENDALRRLASGRKRLLACYRMGTQRSSGTALDMISKAQRDLDALGSDRG